MGRDRVVVVHDRQHSGSERDSLARQALGIPGAVPSLVMALDVRRHRVGKRDGADDVGPDGRMKADVVELAGRQAAGLGEDVLGHGQLADVVQQRGNLQPLDLVRAHARRFAEGGRARFHPPDVVFGGSRFRIDGLVAGVDGPGEGLDRRQVQLLHDARVFLVLAHASQVDPVAVERQPEERRGEEHQPHFLGAHRRGGEGRRAGGHEAGGTGPEEVLPPGEHHRTSARQRDRDRYQPAVTEKERRGPARGGFRDGGEAGLQVEPAQLVRHESRRLNRDDEAGAAEHRLAQGETPALAGDALRGRARRGDEHGFVRTEQHQAEEVGEVRHRQRGLPARQRQVDLHQRRGHRPQEQYGEEQWLVERCAWEPVSHEGRTRRDDESHVHRQGTRASGEHGTKSGERHTATISSIRRARDVIDAKCLC